MHLAFAVALMWCGHGEKRVHLSHSAESKAAKVALLNQATSKGRKNDDFTDA
jgi:hypothetical protein